jgi:hypothetical protein
VSSIHTFQIELVKAFASFTSVGAFMHTHWGWPATESAHFIGLSLLIGTLVPWDLRLLGVGRRIPLAAAHQFVPWVIAGFALTAISGVMFLMAEPSEYIYNVAFHFKVLFMTIAGANALTFYLTVGRRTLAIGSNGDAPRLAKAMAAISLAAWIGVIVSGRLLTFYRPGWCDGDSARVVADCVLPRP